MSDGGWIRLQESDKSRGIGLLHPSLQMIKIPELGYIDFDPLYSSGNRLLLAE